MILICHTWGSIIFNHVRLNLNFKILGEMLICHTQGLNHL